MHEGVTCTGACPMVNRISKDTVPIHDLLGSCKRLPEFYETHRPKRLRVDGNAGSTVIRFHLISPLTSSYLVLFPVIPARARHPWISGA